MDSHPPPKPGLLLPCKPGIIRPHRKILTPAEARGIGHNGGPPLDLAFMPGFGAGRAMVAGDPVPPGPSLSLVSWSENSFAGGTNLSYPTGNATGDLLVLWAAMGATAMTTPTGFIVAVSVGANLGTAGNMAAGGYYRITNGTETGTYTPGASQNSLFMMRFRWSAGPITGITVFSPQQQATASAPTDQTVNVGANVAPLLIIGRSQQNGTSNPGGTLVSTGTYTEAWEGDVPGIRHYHAIQNSSPTSLTFTAPDIGNFNILTSVGLRVTA